MQQTFYLVLFLLSQSRFNRAELTLCTNETDVSPIVQNDTCYLDRIHSALKRHHPYLLFYGFTPNTIYLDCPVCPFEDPNDFEWKFIPRSTHEAIFRKTPDYLYASYYTLAPDLLVDVPVTDSKLQCLIPGSSDLYLTEISSDKFAGTYVCRHRFNQSHPANFVWYHLDSVDQTPMQPLSSERVPDRIRVTSHEELVQLVELAKKDLIAHPGWEDRVHGPFRMTTRLVEDEIFVDRCGLIRIGQERQCYVSIPSDEPAVFNQTEDMYAYRVLRAAFDFLLTAPGYTMPSGQRVRQTVRTQIRRLGFDFQGNGTELYVPCGYSLFQHLFGFTGRLPGFPGIGYRLDVTYDIACVGVGYSELMEFARQGAELKQINFTLPSLVDYRYTKITRLVIRNERNVLLPCLANRRLNCSGPYADALWRAGSDLTFGPPSPGENVHVTEDCSLYIAQIHKYDLDTYYCYLRERTELNEVWSRRPRIAYRLRSEQAKYRWPSENEMLIGLAILITWSACLSVMWVLLSLYDSVTRDHALFEATVKQAGGRIARLKQVYSPFSDEDKALFFRVLQRE